MANSSPPRRATVSLAAAGSRQAPADVDEQLVAGAVAEAVVDDLEAVEVEEQHGDARPALGARQGLREPVDEERPVGQAGERVVEGLAGELVDRRGNWLISWDCCSMVTNILPKEAMRVPISSCRT